MNVMKNIKLSIQSFITKITIEYIFVAFLTSFLIINIFIIQTNDFTNLDDYINNISFSFFWLGLIIIFLVLVYVVHLTKSIEIIPIVFLCSSVCFAISLALNYQRDIYFSIGLAIILFIIVRWVMEEDKLNLSNFNPSYKTVFIISFILFIALTIYIAYTTILRYRIYSSSSFDFGIFAQMFENMYRKGLPDTTVERNVLMSHFGVHFSPSFYLLLPGYFLYQSPEYLLIVQSIFVMFGIFITYGICRKLDLSAKVTLAFVVIYSFYPALSNGCYYDFHENKFLTVLILCTVYFYLSKKMILTILFALLTLGLKEDAAIYVFTLALFFVFQDNFNKDNGKKYVFLNYKNITTIILLSLSVIYFIFAQWVVSFLGEGVMMWRLSDYFISGDKSFASVIKTCFYNIGYLIKQIFIVGKLEFILWMLLPVSFIPFMSKKISTFLIFIPMIVINLMPSWVYQYDINFQYTYGTAALIIIATIFVCAKMNSKARRFVLVFSICISIVFTSTLTFRRGSSYIYNHSITNNKSEAVTKELHKIPTDAKVLASTFLIPHLYRNNRNLYVITESTNSYYEAEYILIDTRYTRKPMFENEILNKNNYNIIIEEEFLSVYKYGENP